MVDKAEKEAAKAVKAEKEAPVTELELEVGDPQMLRPVELPLVVKPANGAAWKNDKQARYAAGLNAYAYKNPAKWGVKKAELLNRLLAIGDNPSLFDQFAGNPDSVGLSYKNKIIEQ